MYMIKAEENVAEEDKSWKHVQPDFETNTSGQWPTLFLFIVIFLNSMLG